MTQRELDFDYPIVPFMLRAEQVSAELIGSTLEFDWQFASSKVFATIRGELRQIAHDSNSSVLLLVGEVGADLQEFELDHASVVSVIQS